MPCIRDLLLEHRSEFENYDLLKRQVESGYNGAEINLGLYYLLIGNNEKLAYYWFFKVANHGDEWGMFWVGFCLRKGIGASVNYIEAEKYLSPLAESGNIHAQYILGDMYLEMETDKTESGITLLTKAANANQSDALIRLGDCYCEGIYFDVDYSRSFSFYKSAADLGDADAMARVGSAYYDGEGVAVNKAEALSWAKKSVELGSRDGEFLLANYYEDEDNDMEKAIYWYTRAAEHGDDCAQYYLGFCYENGEGVETDISKAIYWYTKAADRGNAKSQCSLGDCYLNGIGVSPDPKKAHSYYILSAEQGNILAQNTLATMYTVGNGVDVNYKTAAMWLTKAAEQGDSGSQRLLGKMYSMDLPGLPKDIKQAIYWLTKAINQGHTEAQTELDELMWGDLE